MSIRVQTLDGEIKFLGDAGPQGNSLEFNWVGTQLGIRVHGQTEYQYVDLKGAKGDTGAGLEFTWSGTQLGVRVAGTQEYQYVDLKGDTGNDGYTPVKGTDYWTSQDKSEIENDVITSITPILNEKADKSEIPDVSSFIDKNVNDLVYYELKSNTGSLIELSINNTTYVITMKLKNSSGGVISTGTIDLPLESVVVSGRYDNNTKKVILTLENGSEVDFSVADLVAGLQTEITSNNKLASDLVDDTNSGNKFVTTSDKTAWNAKYNKPSGGIPKTDLSSGVQTSLDKADTALQTHQDLSGYVQKTDFLTGSFAPTTSTIASFVGQIYIDTTNNKTYQCTAITTENNITTYTWVQLIRADNKANSTNLGVVKTGSNLGVTVNANGEMYIDYATNNDIDAKSSYRKPIVPAQLNYAVASVKASQSQSGSAKMWTSTNEDDEIGLNISTQ